MTPDLSAITELARTIQGLGGASLLLLGGAAVWYIVSKTRNGGGRSKPISEKTPRLEADLADVLKTISNQQAHTAEATIAMASQMERLTTAVDKLSDNVVGCANDVERVRDRIDLVVSPTIKTILEKVAG